MSLHAWAGSDADGAFEKIKSKSEKKKDRLLSMDPKDISYEMVSKKLQDIMLARGKKGVDRQEQVNWREHSILVVRS